jgi:hypothetical protein
MVGHRQVAFFMAVIRSSEAAEPISGKTLSIILI